MTWTIRPLVEGDPRSSFTCGTQPQHHALDAWFHDHAWNYMAKKFATVFVATPADGQIDGYYSLNAGSVPLDLLPTSERIRYPKHPVPVAHIGRLARHIRVRGQSLGGDLLVDAIRRAQRLAQSELGIAAMEVIAVDDKARAFYERYGFVSLLDKTDHMYLSMKTVAKLKLT